MKQQLQLKAIVYLRDTGYQRICNIDQANKTAAVCLSEEILETCKVAREYWALLSFSDLPELSLKRYFNYELTNINKCLAKIGDIYEVDELSLIQDLFLQQTEHLLTFFDYLIDRDANPSKSFRFNWLSKRTADMELLSSLLTNSTINSFLVSIIISYIKQLSDNDGAFSFSYAQLDYFHTFLNGLLGLLKNIPDNLESKIVGFLISINFNSLSFFVYYQNCISEELSNLTDATKRDCLKRKLILFQFDPLINTPIYDKSWPAITFMIRNMLKEELVAAKEAISKKVPKGELLVRQKFPLNLSVSQLACFLKIFHDEGIFGQPNLTELFKFMAQTFSTKRQQIISYGSLSKEYYSIDQVTAAIVLDHLQKMIIRINKSYFP